MIGSRGVGFGVVVVLVLAGVVAGSGRPAGAAGCAPDDLGAAGLHNFEPAPVALSGDGGIVAFVDRANDHIVVRDVRTGAVEQVDPVHDQPMMAAPSLSRDGTLLAYVEVHVISSRGGLIPLPQAYVLDRATGARTEIAPDLYPWHPALSPDGRSVAYLTDLEGHYLPDTLVRRELASGQETVLATGLLDAWHGGAPLSVSGARVVFSGHFDPRRPVGLHLYRRATGDHREVTPDPPGRGRSPRLLLDRRRVTFRTGLAGDRDNPGRSHVLDLATGRSRVVRPGALDGMLSGDGRRVVYASPEDRLGQNPEHNVELFRFDRDTRTTRQLTSTAAGRPSLLAVSDDGGTVVYASQRNRDGSLQLAVSGPCGG